MVVYIVHRLLCPTPPNSLRKYTEMYVLHDEGWGWFLQRRCQKVKERNQARGTKAKSSVIVDQAFLYQKICHKYGCLFKQKKNEDILPMRERYVDTKCYQSLSTYSVHSKKKHVMIKEHQDRNDEDEEDLPEEQQAGILVLNADPIGWEEEEELDYTHINQGVTDTNRLPTLPIVHRPSIQGEGWEVRRGSEAPSDRGMYICMLYAVCMY